MGHKICLSQSGCGKPIFTCVSLKFIGLQLRQAMSLQNAKGFFLRDRFKISNRVIKLDGFCILIRVQKKQDPDKDPGSQWKDFFGFSRHCFNPNKVFLVRFSL